MRLLSGCWIVCALLCSALQLWAADGALPAPGFQAEAGGYSSVAAGEGSSAQEALEKARGAALRGLFEALGKDRLFAEVFMASPPLSLSIQLLDSSRRGATYQALVRLQIDDESVRIVERGAYLAAAIGILDKAEAGSDEAEAMRASASEAESAADLGDALERYGMAIDASRAALELVDPVADPSLFSTKGKRTAPDIKKGLASTLAAASAGVDRVKQAESALASDATNAAAISVAEAAIAEVDAAQALLDELAPALAELGSSGPEKLGAMRDRISMQRRSLSDSRLALQRAAAALPAEESEGSERAAKGPTFASAKGPTFASAKGPTFAKDQIDFARHRLETADGSLLTAYRNVDREIRDPAARRAARAQTFKWIFLHRPREYLSVRAYLPFEVSAGEGPASASPLDARAGLEGAFPLGSGGVWVRSQADLANFDLDPGQGDGQQLALTQSFDFGVWGKALYFAGYRWDWLRRVDGGSFPKLGAVELGVGGVYAHGPGADGFRRADWQLALSYELPYSFEDLGLWKVLNAGIQAQFRLGDLFLLEAAASKRLEELPADGAVAQYVSVLKWSIGLGLRVPPPFAFGAEYFGSYVQPLLEDDSLGPAAMPDGGHFRFYVQYSI